jgi:hypothetical protein
MHILSAGFSKTGKRKPGSLTLAAYPRIVYWWHPSKNVGKPGNHPHDTPSRVWLQCRGCPVCGEVHEWDAQIFHLTQFGGDFVCPRCDSRGGKFCSCRSVASNKQLAAEWHEDNPSPSQVALGSNLKHKWRCSNADCGNIWEARPNCRSNAGRGCPECSQMKSVRGFKKVNLAEARPDLVPEWDEERNACPATSVTRGSSRVVWWVCQECQGSWQTRVYKRASNGSGCPLCRELNRRKPRKFLQR